MSIRRRHSTGIGKLPSVAAKGVSTIMHTEVITANIIKVIHHADRESAAYLTQWAKAMDKGNQRATLHAIWRWLRDEITYRRDRIGYEKVQSPGALYQSRTGDCKSLSVWIGGCCRVLGIPYKFRYTYYEGQDDWSHIYVVAGTNYDIIVDAVHDRFDEEVPYIKKKDIKRL